MIDYVLPCKHVFTVKIHNELGTDSLTEDDWTVCTIFHSFLKTFYNHTVNLSVVYISISNVALHSLLEFTESFSANRELPLLQLAVRRMEAIYKKY